MDDKKFKKLLKDIYPNFDPETEKNIPIDDPDWVENTRSHDEILAALSEAFGAENITVIDCAEDIETIEAELELREHLQGGGQLN